MSSLPSNSWSLMRSLAFLAAIFALTMGALLPSAVAASPATGTPVMLCSGDRMMVAHDVDGAPKPAKPSPADSLQCASCILAALTALPAPPPTPVRPPVATQPRLLAVPASPAPTLADVKRRRPPPTAPPVS